LNLGNASLAKPREFQSFQENMVSVPCFLDAISGELSDVQPSRGVKNLFQAPPLLQDSPVDKLHRRWELLFLGFFHMQGTVAEVSYPWKSNILRRAWLQDRSPDYFPTAGFYDFLDLLLGHHFVVLTPF
tara:strand:+ start:2005 stop:2391 length:387 start_codon:yes stop_codon:yes gene_type:complete